MTTKKNNKPKKSKASAVIESAYDEFATKVGLKLTSTRVDKNPNAPDWDAVHWKVKLARGKKSFITYYSKTHGHGEEPPTVEEVLCCITIDARILEKAKNYQEWLVEYSFEDEPRARTVYDDAKRVSDALKGIFNPDEFKSLLAIGAAEDEVKS